MAQRQAAAAAARRAAQARQDAGAAAFATSFRRGGAEGAAALAAVEKDDPSGSYNNLSRGMVDPRSGVVTALRGKKENDLSRRRRDQLGRALGLLGRNLEQLTGGDLGSFEIQASERSSGYRVGGVDKLNAFSGNDMQGLGRAFLVDAIDSLQGAAADAVAVLRKQDWADVAQSFALAADELYRQRNPIAYALGGRVTGPGTGTSDSIPALLSNGEHVIRAAAAGRYGHDVLDRVNDNDLEGAYALAAAKGRVPAMPAFRDGGAVRITPPPPGPRPAAGAAGVGQFDAVKELEQIRKVLERLLAEQEDGHEDGADRDRRAERLLARVAQLLERLDARAGREAA